MARVDITQDVVLERIATRLRSELDLTESQCYETMEPEEPPAVPTGGGYFLTVAPQESQFVEEQQHPVQCMEQWAVAVTIYSRVHLDQTGRNQNALRDAARGLLAIKKDVLAALVGHDLATSDGDVFLRQLLYARSCTAPRAMDKADGALTLAVMTITFGVDYDWDLS